MKSTPKTPRHLAVEWAWGQRGVVAVQAYPNPTFITVHVKDADAHARLVAILSDTQFTIQGVQVKLAPAPAPHRTRLTPW